MGATATLTRGRSDPVPKPVPGSRPLVNDRPRFAQGGISPGTVCNGFPIFGVTQWRRLIRSSRLRHGARDYRLTSMVTREPPRTMRKVYLPLSPAPMTR